ncbi:phosphomannomutase/phosphoglucomutase [Aliagarivorans taiwanensis]|uniref:phosphomannomutase/phosphoglucomutase n=1 Tax=Aliagarivorans taiwanensis TaxID=561966 RepID=UPI0003FF9EFE|nr:phosphomannomutase/phosphoglucomutase [Aliagarivorans taiwanensis]
MKMAMDCFKAYDIRGKLGEQLNDEVAYRIGRATGQFLKAEGHPKPAVVVGGDVRETSEPLKRALASGIMDAGLDVIDIGMVGTEEIYFATKHLDVAGGVEVTASHNPIDYNGMKLVREQSKPISGDTGLNDIKALAESGEFAHCEQAGGFQSLSLTDAYVEHLLGYIDVAKLKLLKIVVNAGNGAAGHVVDALEQKLPQIEFIKVHHEPDGSFPNGIPNPLLPENRSATSEAVLAHGADLGIAWDGDFDRCFLFDENGQFIEGYYIVGLLAEAFLQQQPGAKIIHDPRLTWNTQAVVEQAGGVAVMSKTGHAFIKERMRQEDAIYGGEMSAHHYFRDFAYCDSGMIPWLLIAELVSVKGQGLASMVEQAIGQFPSSGEINSRLEDPNAAIERVLNTYQEAAANIDHTDGISMCFADEQGAWRFNLRSSNTEPVVRLNVESRGNIALMEQKTEEVLAILRS